MAFPGGIFNGVRILPHDKYSGTYVAVGFGHSIECSRPSPILHTAIWVIRTELKGLWCTVHNTFWAAQPLPGGPGAGYPVADFVVRFELEPSNGRCRCHGTSVAPYPLPHTYSIVATAIEGTRIAGHVDRTLAQNVSVIVVQQCACTGTAAAESRRGLLLQLSDRHYTLCLQMANCGVWALLGGGNVPPQCQMLGVTHGLQYNMGPFINPRSVDMSLYIFGEPTPAFHNAMTALRNIPGNANNVVQLLGPAALLQVPALVS